MAFFVGRLRYRGIGWSFPITLYAKDMQGATSRLNLEGVESFDLRERPQSESSFYGREKEDQAVVEHTKIEWRPD